MGERAKLGDLSVAGAFFRRHAASLALGVATLTLCNLLQMTFPRLVGWAIDLLGGEGPLLSELRRPVLWILGLALSVAILRYIWRRNIYGFSRRMERDLRESLYSRFVALSLRWHQGHPSGDLMALATNDIDAVRQAVGYGFVSLVDALVLGLAAIAFMLSISPGLCLLAFIPLPLITVMAIIFNRRMFRRVLRAQNVFGELTERVRERLSGFRVIRAMGLEPLAMREISSKSMEFVGANVRMAVLTGLFFPLLYLFTNASLALTIYFGGSQVIAGTLSAGGFVAFVTYLTLITWPLMALGLTMGRLQQGMASLRRLGGVLSVEEPSGHPEELAFDPPEGGDFRVDLRDLGFTYPGANAPALSSLTLSLCPGKMTAMTGPTGSGKSTLAQLLMALHEPQEGAILIDGRDSKEYPLAKLRSLFGYVPQDGHIFSGTLFQNVAFGKPEASEEEVLDACLLAQLPMDLDVFPQGLSTVVGERGMTLSGGQRQRVALARALLMDPPYLILDDTLSAVDANVEDRILNSICRLREGRGTLVISHRLTSLARAERILVLERGRLTQEGSYESLSEEPGYFRRIREIATLKVEKDRLSKGSQGAEGVETEP
jgi:ATP-binding cassette subfamily B protein